MWAMSSVTAWRWRGMWFTAMTWNCLLISFPSTMVCTAPIPSLLPSTNWQSQIKFVHVVIDRPISYFAVNIANTILCTTVYPVLLFLFSVLPLCSDGDIEDFKLVSLADVAKLVCTPGQYKLNSALVVMDFLFRHGYVFLHAYIQSNRSFCLWFLIETNMNLHSTRIIIVFHLWCRHIHPLQAGYIRLHESLHSGDNH